MSILLPTRRYLLAPKRLWTPASITTALWLDAADASTITLNNTTVSQWNDKSGNGRALTQAVSSQQPVYQSAHLNNRNTILFDGTNDILATTNAGSVGVNNVSFFMVTRYVSISSEDIAFGIGQTGATRAIRAFYTTNTNQTQGLATWGNDVLSSNSIDAGGQHHIFSAIQNGQNVFQYRDGVSSTTQPTVLPQVPLACTFNGASLGSLQGSAVGNYYSNISVAEIVAIYSIISDDDRLRIEGYLAHKWGLTANLPADHPFRFAAPRV